jgi:hypothetical protein
MRTIKTYSERTPFYDAVTSTCHAFTYPLELVTENRECAGGRPTAAVAYRQSGGHSQLPSIRVRNHQWRVESCVLQRGL